MFALKLTGDSPKTIEKVMMNHIMFTLAMADDEDPFPIVMHYHRGE